MSRQRSHSSYVEFIALNDRLRVAQATSAYSARRYEPPNSVSNLATRRSANSGSSAPRFLACVPPFRPWSSNASTRATWHHGWHGPQIILKLSSTRPRQSRPACHRPGASLFTAASPARRQDGRGPPALRRRRHRRRAHTHPAALDLTTQAGYSANYLAQFFQPQQFFWTAIGNLTASIFDAGRRRGDKVRRSHVRRDGRILRANHLSGPSAGS